METNGLLPAPPPGPPRPPEAIRICYGARRDMPTCQVPLADGDSVSMDPAHVNCAGCKAVLHKSALAGIPPTPRGGLVQTGPPGGIMVPPGEPVTAVLQQAIQEASGITLHAFLASLDPEKLEARLKELRAETAAVEALLKVMKKPARRKKKATASPEAVQPEG